MLVFSLHPGSVMSPALCTPRLYAARSSHVHASTSSLEGYRSQVARLPQILPGAARTGPSFHTRR